MIKKWYTGLAAMAPLLCLALDMVSAAVYIHTNMKPRVWEKQ